MGKKKDYTGMEFGDLRVIRCVGTSNSGRPLLKCKCNRCGNTVILESSTLSKKTDCGCSPKKRQVRKDDPEEKLKKKEKENEIIMERVKEEALAKYGMEVKMLPLKEFAKIHGYAEHTIYSYVSEGAISEDDIIRIHGFRGKPRVMIRYDSKPVLTPEISEKRKTEEAKERVRAWRFENPEKIREYHRRHYLSHKEEVKAAVAAYKKSKKKPANTE